MTAVESVSVFAPAKVNLYLHVTGKRADGYHLVDSLMVFAGVGDVVEAAPAEKLSLTIDGPFAQGLAAEDDNLVLRAARALQEASRRREGAALRLTKSLPVASGIGGGSADAAAAMKALIVLWRLELADDVLQKIALSLGADVPVCLAGRPAFVAGVGEVLSPVPPLPACWLVLANPGDAVSTPAVFKARKAAFSQPAPFDQTPASVSALTEALAARANDLEAPACEIAPTIGAVLAGLQAQDACLLARMSGSGATCFGLFAKEAEARSAAQRISAANPGWWTAAAPVLQ